jgi:4-alpha-glucanotransferase
MSAALLHELAQLAGIATTWTDATGAQHAVSQETLRALLAALDLGTANDRDIADGIERLRQAANGFTDGNALPPLLIADAGAPIRLHGPSGMADGNYRIELEGGALIDGVATRGEDGTWTLPAVGDMGYHQLSFAGGHATLAVAPPRCFTIHDIGTGDTPRLWGVASAVYALRRKGDGGIGDFGGLSESLIAAAKLGADAFAINPLHALFSAMPERFSPYAPSNRAFLNPLHADPASVLGAAAARGGVPEEFDTLEALALIDWPAASRVKLRLLRKSFDGFLNRKDLTVDYSSFREKGGQALEDHARFEAIQAALLPQDPLHGNWRNWPANLQDPRGQGVADFACRHADEVSFHIFLQWLSDRSLAAAQKAGRDAGMKIGIMADLAIGATADGSYAWSRPADMLQSLSIGAPPDLFNMHGQSWGIAPLSPHALRSGGYRAFLDALRATMKHAGGIRIDHAMGLARLWIVPNGAAASDGAYLSYPARDLFRLIALESWRNRCIVMGEDLGTVPPGFRDTLRDAGILGMQVMWFERDRSGYFSPHIYSTEAMATTTTHDLPTVVGWWQGSDIADREHASVISEAEAAREVETREADRAALWRTFVSCEAADGGCPAWTEGERAVEAATAFIGMTPSPLVILPLSDALALPEQANMPGTFDEHPNWRQRLPGSAKDIFDDPGLRARLGALARLRPAGKP